MLLERGGLAAAEGAEAGDFGVPGGGAGAAWSTNDTHGRDSDKARMQLDAGARRWLTRCSSSVHTVQGAYTRVHGLRRHDRNGPTATAVVGGSTAAKQTFEGKFATQKDVPVVAERWQAGSVSRGQVATALVAATPLNAAVLQIFHHTARARTVEPAARKST